MNRFFRSPLPAAALSLALSLFLALPASAAEVAGTHIDDKASVAGSDLTLNGAGLRTRFMLKIYTIGLYLPKRGEAVELEGLRIQVLRADSRRVYTLIVERLPQPLPERA